MEQMFDLFKLAGLAISVAFMTMILKKAGRDIEATAISIAGVAITLIIIAGYIMQLFEAVETMMTF